MKIVSVEKKLVAPLIDGCTETVEEVKLAKKTIAENKDSYKCSSCTLYTVLFWIFFTINVGGIGAYYVYSQRYFFKKDVSHMSTLILALKQQFTECNFIEHINGKNQTN